MEGTKSNQGGVSEVSGPRRPAQKGPHNLPCGRWKAGILTPGPVLHQLRTVPGGPHSASFSSVPELSAGRLPQLGEVPDETGSNVPELGCSQGSWNHSCDRNQRGQPRGCEAMATPNNTTVDTEQAKQFTGTGQAWLCLLCIWRKALPASAHPSERSSPAPQDVSSTPMSCITEGHVYGPLNLRAS